MKYYKDSSGGVHAFEDDVIVKENAKGETIAIAPDGMQLADVPGSLKQFTPPQPTSSEKLTDAKNEKLLILDSETAVEIEKGITFNGVHYATTPNFVQNINSLMNIINAGTYTSSVVNVSDAEGVPITLSLANFKTMSTQALGYGQTVYEKLWAARKKVANVGSEANWAASNTQVVGDMIQNNEYVYRCSTAGTTGSAPPAFPQTQGTKVGDNTVVWECLGTFEDVITSITL